MIYRELQSIIREVAGGGGGGGGGEGEALLPDVTASTSVRVSESEAGGKCRAASCGGG